MSARTRVSVTAVFAVLAISSVALAGCKSASAGSATETATPTPTVTASPTVSPSADAAPPSGQFALPATCQDAYSIGMLASLSNENPPLNDPGFSLRSTQNVTGLELLDSGIPTLNCTWGVAGQRGLATSVAQISESDSDRMMTALEATGFVCEAHGEGTICTYSEKTVNRDDEIVELGESHYFRSTGWVATSWINFFPEGYTEDIAATVWG